MSKALRPSPGRQFVVALVLALLFAPALAGAGQTPAEAPAAAPTESALIEALQPAVVNITITSYTRTPAAIGNMAGQSTVAEHSEQSSGFFIDPRGIIVTNQHVIANANEITATLQDGTRLNATIIASTKQSDIALLKVNPGRQMAVVRFGDSDRMRPGDQVFVIGNPLGLGNTVTAGIVSALDRNTAQSKFSSFFQIDASLNHGNSGGPVFNAAGEVIGIATALFSPEGETGSVGLGLAIPANDARLIINRLRDAGEVQLGWIGAHVQRVTADIATAIRLPLTTGAIITAIDPDSPATRAHLESGDVVLQIENEKQNEPRILSRRISDAAIGSVLNLTIWRDGSERVMPIVIAPSPGNEKKAPAAATAPPATDPKAGKRRDLGLILAPATETLRDKLGVPENQQGVTVVDTVDDSVASDHGVKAGSLIVKVNRQPVASPADVQAQIDVARSDNQALVLFLLKDPQGLHWVALPLTAAAQ